MNNTIDEWFVWGPDYTQEESAKEIKDTSSPKVVEVPCKTCQRKVYTTDVNCWWCDCRNPGIVA